MNVPFIRFVEFVDTVAEGKDTRLIFERWVQGLPKSLGPVVFRLLFPELDVARRFSFSESRLAKVLASVLRIPVLQLSETYVDTGCLGSALAASLTARSGSDCQELTLIQVDELLNDLAALSPWSHHSIRASRKRNEADILRELYANSSPSAAALLTQLILKSINPLLYPASSQRSHTTKKPARTILTIWDAMRVWDLRMAGIYRVRSDLSVAAQTLLEIYNNPIGPLLGVPVEIPKCFKARSIKNAFDVLNSSGAKRAFAEVKYDGERMQIHVDFSKPIREQITIFSKSKRDSTWDRAGTHPYVRFSAPSFRLSRAYVNHSIIRAALGQPLDSQTPGVAATSLLVERVINKDRKYWSKHIPETLPNTDEAIRAVKKSAILECEMVAYDELRGKIDEFWRVRNLVESTAIGVRARKAPEEAEPESIPSDSTLSQCNAGNHTSRSEPHAARHLALVFFDILYLNGQSLVDKPFQERRQILEQAICRIPGWVGLSSGVWINLSDSTSDTNTQSSTSTSSIHQAQEALIQRFSQVIANREEGLVVKPCSGPRARWVKMKKDYIPGLGDCADFVVVGAGHDRERARELGLSSSVLTTFYIGVWTNEDNLGARPTFDVLFTVSYGLSREQLEALDLTIQSASRYEEYRANGQYMRVPYDVRLSPTLKSRPPKMWLLTPMLFELMGAGFTKSEASGHYELRFPRIIKIHSPIDRPWTCGLGARSLLKLAREAIGLEERPTWGSPEDLVDRIWGENGTGSTQEKRRDRIDTWARALGGKRWHDMVTTQGQGRPTRTEEQITDISLDELGGPSECEDATGDELDSDDINSWGGDRRFKRSNVELQENNYNERTDGESWKRTRLAASRSSDLNLGFKDVFSTPDDNIRVELHSGSSNSNVYLDLPDDSATPKRTDSSASQPSSSCSEASSYQALLKTQAHDLATASLLADAFIYVAHRSAPHPTSLIPASHRVFSQDALLAGLDWNGARHKRRTLGTHTAIDQKIGTPRILKGIVIVDDRREDVDAIIKWGRSQGVLVSSPMIGKQTNKPILYFIAPKAKSIYDSDYAGELDLKVLCVISPP